jgi:hypothetical protein
LNRWDESEQATCYHASASCERQHSPVEQRARVESEVQVEPDAVRQGKIHRKENIEEHECQDEATSRSAEPEQRVLDEQLARERASGCAKSPTQSDLLPAIQRACEL